MVAAPAPVVSAPPPPPVSTPTAPARNTGLVAISTPQPAYPPEARRAGISGEVELEITIDTDRSVSDTKVIRATPRNTFERGVQSTVRRWKFQPVPAPTTIRRTFAFKS